MTRLKIALVFCSPRELIGPLEKNFITVKEIKQEVDLIAQSLARVGHDVQLVEVQRDAILPKLVEIGSSGVDIIFNACEGPAGDALLEPQVAALYEILRIPYTGSDWLTLRLALDKARSKKIFIKGGVPTPSYKVFNGGRFEWRDEIHFPVIVKPVREDASAGITRDSVVSDVDSLKEKVEALYVKYNEPVLIEEYIEGRELNVSIVGNYSPEVLPIGEIDFSALPEGIPNICSFEAKWVQDSAEFRGTVPVCPASLPQDVERIVCETALKAYRLMGCRDYARVDIRLSKENIPYVLEVNPNPDISPDAGFIRSARAYGWSYGDVMNNIVRFAAERTGFATYDKDKADSEEG